MLVNHAHLLRRTCCSSHVRLRWPPAIPAAAYRLAMYRLNTHPGLLEASRAASQRQCLQEGRVYWQEP